MDVAAICEAHGPPPECGQMPEFPSTASDKDIFLMIAGEDQKIDSFEACRMLYCATEWGLMSIEEAMAAYEEGMIQAGSDGKLSLEDAGLA